MHGPWYYQNKIKIIDERLELEREYRYNLDKLIKFCMRKYRIYLWASIVLVAIDILLGMFFAPTLKRETIVNVGDLVAQQIMLIPGALIAGMTVPGAVFCVYKFFYYRKRCAANKDPKDGEWRTYKAMMDRSSNMSDILEKDRIEAVSSLEVSRFDEEDHLEVDDMSDGPEPERHRDDVIPISELMKLKK